MSIFQVDILCKRLKDRCNFMIIFLWNDCWKHSNCFIALHYLIMFYTFALPFILLCVLDALLSYTRMFQNICLFLFAFGNM